MTQKLIGKKGWLIMTKSELKNRYLSSYPIRSIGQDQINNIESELSVVLPKDMKEILTYYDGYYDLNNMSVFYLGDNDEWSMLEKTKFFRKSIHLPKRYLVLKEGDESFIALETRDNENQPTPVIWCSGNDAYNLAEEKPLEDNPTIFSSFTDFFAYLLNEEEKRRAEEKSL